MSRSINEDLNRLSAGIISNDPLARADAWEELVDIFHSKFFGYAMTHLSNREDAENVVNITFERIIVSLPRKIVDKDDPLLNPEAYLWTILKNNCTNILRERRHPLVYLGEYEDLELLENAMPDYHQNPDPTAGGTDVEKQAQLVDLIHRIVTPRQAEILELRWIKCLKPEEAAQALGKSYGASKTGYSRAHWDFFHNVGLEYVADHGPLEDIMSDLEERVFTLRYFRQLGLDGVLTQSGVSKEKANRAYLKHLLKRAEYVLLQQFL